MNDEMEKRVCTRHEYTTRTPAVEAHRRLLMSFPQITFREVEFWYRAFDNRDFNLQQEVNVDYKDREFMHLPDHIVERIVEEVGVDDQKALRLVTPNLTKMIDDQEKLFENIEVFFKPTGIRLSTNMVKIGNNRFLYKERNGGCEKTQIENGTVEIFDDTFIDKALSDFRKCIEKKRTKVKELIIKYEYSKETEMQAQNRNFVVKMEEILKTLTNKLHVEELEIFVETPQNLLTVLERLKSDCLKALEFRGPFDLFEMKQIVNVPHWPNIRKLLIYYSTVDIAMKHFEHMDYVYIHLNLINPEEISDHKNRILQNPTFHKHEIKGPVDQEAVKNSLEPFTPPSDDFAGYAGSFLFPNENAKHLIFRFNDSIEFKKVKI